MYFDDDERIVPRLGFATFPKELVTPPREWAERFFDVARWTQMPRGGHFAALERPELLAEDLRAFFRDIRTCRLAVSDRRSNPLPLGWRPQAPR
jgi:pimeloyl-ACP methyl ester carboxylesterase